MKMKTTAVMLLAMSAAMPALADNSAAVKGEAQVESEGGFFSRTLGGIRNIFGGDEAVKENEGKSEAAHENAAESKAEGQAKAAAAKDKGAANGKEKTKDSMKAAKEKAAKDKSKMKDKAASAKEKAADKSEDGKANAAGQAEAKADKADEAAAKNDQEKGKSLGAEGKIGIKLGN